MGNTLTLCIETRRDELRRLHDMVEEFGEAEGWSMEVLFQVNLALDEIGVNVINHGHDDDSLHEIQIDIRSEPDAVTIEVADDGRPFDPLTEAPPPDLESDVGDRAVGGLGIHLVCNLMDDVVYKREDGKNRLTLVKRRSE